MGFVKIFWKNNIQETYLPNSSIVTQIVSDILAQLWFWCLNVKTQVKFRRICMESSKHNCANTCISETICSEKLIFGK